MNAKNTRLPPNHQLIDKATVASADVPVLYRVRGDAYIARKGIGALLADQPIGELIDATVRSVDIDTGSNP
jgi:hypothetical protein